MEVFDPQIFNWNNWNWNTYTFLVIISNLLGSQYLAGGSDIRVHK